jgi:hypothetical protein
MTPAPPRIQIPPGLEHLAFNTNPFVFFVFFLDEKAFVYGRKKKTEFLLNLCVGVGSSPEN